MQLTRVNLFRGAKVGEDGFSLSHLFYAADVLFMGELDHQNSANLVMILK